MLTRTTRTSFSASLPLAALALLMLCLPSPAAMAQKADETYIGVITGDDVYVRSGPSDSYYPFTKLATSDMVNVMAEKILDEKSRWARVATTGPAFRGAYGYIRYTSGDTSKVRIASDGQSGVTLGRVDVIAPNLDAKGAPKDSWKPLVRLEADQNVEILETIQTDKDTVLKVALPEGAQGWVALSFIRKANDTETAQFKASLTSQSTTPTTTAKPTDIVHGSTPKPADTTTTPSHTDVTKPTTEGTTQNTAPAAGDTTTTTNGQPTDTANTTPGQTGDTTTNTAAAATPPTTKPAVAPHPPTLEELEGAFKLLQKEMKGDKIETVEVTPLREMYLELGKRNPTDKRIMQYVSTRADQLQVWTDLQKRHQDLADIRSRLNASAEETEAARKALESSAQYTAVGRIAASTIYDGEGLPKLLRLQDGATGRTVAYLQPDEEYKLVNLIGNLVGIVGEKTYDGSLRLNIIQPRRIDILTTDSPTQAVSAESQTPAKP